MIRAIFGILAEREGHASVLDPVDRVSEMCFGLFMALTFVGSISMATAERQDIRTMLFAALGCNIAWGLADGVMALVSAIVARGRSLTLAREVRAATDEETAYRIIEQSIGPTAMGEISKAEKEAIRARLLALPFVPKRPKLMRDDILAALGIFLICVISTFPVALPFMVVDQVAIAKTISRIVALAMLFAGGYALGRWSGYGGFKAGFLMIALGSALIGAIMALGG